jgi:hypothetical protein
MLDFHSNSNAHMERDSISFRKYLSAATVHFQPREKPLTTQNLFHQNLPRFPCHSPYSCMDLLKQHLGKSAHNKLLYLDVRTADLQKTQKNCLENRATTCLNFRANVCCCTACSANKSAALQNRKFLLGICAQVLLGNVPTLAAHFLLQTLLRNLSHTLLLSIYLAHYPMHSFINLNMTFSLQSVFSPLPTLNPKAKI